MDISFSAILTWVKSAFIGALNWIKACLLWLFDSIYNTIAGAIELIIDNLLNESSFSVTAFINAYNALQAHSSGIAYVTNTLNLGYGITVMAGALVLRFLIRRLPIIG